MTGTDSTKLTADRKTSIGGISDSPPFPRPIAPDWLTRSSLEVAPDLLGCILVRQLPDGQILRGTIVETEAYTPGDPACHAYQRRTARNEVMFGEAGVSYVYLIYGIYHCLNVVTDRNGVASAVLIRALQLSHLPAGVDAIAAKKPDRLAAGPGKLCRLFQIDLSLNGTLLAPGNPLWLEHRPPQFQQGLQAGAIEFIQTTRIGLTQGVDLPWRWYVKGNRSVSVKCKEEKKTK